MTCIIRKATVGEAWAESLKLFFKPKQIYRHESMKGPYVEVEDVIFEISNPLREPQVSPLFPKSFSPLIDDFTEKLSTRQIGHISTTNDRLYRWPRRDGTKFDQVAFQIEKLRNHPESRSSVLGFWDPDSDAFSDQPIVPLVAYFRVRSERLQTTIITRSVDAWIGAIPILIGFANLQKLFAQAVDYQVGTMKFMAFSYHLYEMDLPVVFSKLGGSL